MVQTVFLEGVISLLSVFNAKGMVILRILILFITALQSSTFRDFSRAIRVNLGSVSRF